MLFSNLLLLFNTCQRHPLRQELCIHIIIFNCYTVLHFPRRHVRPHLFSKICKCFVDVNHIAPLCLATLMYLCAVLGECHQKFDLGVK